eukprot:TRINITY_DN20736_c0_g1_i1.p1 TRINITY_DN20736_c0_g1~~TRINITY_DN20736_c0_g1_i1.p1  ORF type:complete len:732 (+),score=135.19 TRINITY_DN20736_c0_g1_i1:651-2846(+)
MFEKHSVRGAVAVAPPFEKQLPEADTKVACTKQQCLSVRCVPGSGTRVLPDAYLQGHFPAVSGRRKCNGESDTGAGRWQGWLRGWRRKRRWGDMRREGSMRRVLWTVFLLTLPSSCFGSRPLQEGSNGEAGDGEMMGPATSEDSGTSLALQYPANISGIYRGSWLVGEVTLNLSTSSTSPAPPLLHFPDLQKSSGNIILQLRSDKTGKREIHYVYGEVVLRDGVYMSDGDVHLRMEGVYIRPFGELRMVISRATDPEIMEAEGGTPSTYHLTGLQALNTPTRERRRRNRNGLRTLLDRGCMITLVTQMAPVSWDWKGGVQEHVPNQMSGLLLDSVPRDEDERWADAASTSGVPSKRSQRLHHSHQSQQQEGRHGGAGQQAHRQLDEDEGVECFAPMVVNATAVNVEAYYSKAVNYTLMVTFISFLQVLVFIRQMEHSNTQSGAAKVSLLMIGQQAIMDAYLCLLHLTAGIIVESLFNAFATAAFFKFVIFSIFEMRYLLAIWKARRPTGAGEGWETLRRELSVLYSRFYGFLLGGILLMYQLHAHLRSILLLFYAFWLPQIVNSVVRDARRPLHPHYILGMTITRAAIPLYAFGCPKNFMRIQPSPEWCMALIALLGGQAGLLLLQHYFGARCFIPKQFLPEKYSYFRKPERGSPLLSNSTSSGGGGGNGASDESCSALDCVICMAPVDDAPRSTLRMVTPCEHLFHTGCLQRWMDIKMECPTCRRPLPPI